MTVRQSYKLRLGTHNIEREVAPLIEAEFPEYETFFDKHLFPLTKNGHWRNDTLENLELIGMASFAVLKSINFIHRNVGQIKRGDPDQRFKNIYFHFGLVADSVDSLSRNIAFTCDHLGLFSIDRKTKDPEELKSSFDKWIQKRYEKGLKDLFKTGRQLVHHPHSVDFLKYTISDTIRNEYKMLVTSLKEYRNFYTHNPGVDVIQFGIGDIYVVKREKIDEARSWSNLRGMIEKSLDTFIDPKEQINNDLGQLLKYLRLVWNEFGTKMDQVRLHEDYRLISQGFQRSVE